MAPCLLALSLAVAECAVEKALAAAFSPFLKKGAQAGTPEPLPMTDSEMDASTGVYRNRWPVTLVREDGALLLEQFGGRFPVSKRGDDLFAAETGGDRPPIPFRIIAGADGRAELLQMFLRIFKKEGAAP